VTVLPQLTPAARDHLAGRPVVLRGSPRNGCCGGRALVPIAEVGPPRDAGGYEQRTADGISWYVAPQLLPEAGGWTIDAVGLGRWRRLQLLGAEQLDPSARVQPVEREEGSDA
jgi:hypothetical protein